MKRGRKTAKKKEEKEEEEEEVSKPSSKKVERGGDEESDWEKADKTLYVYNPEEYKTRGYEKIMGFDMDDTLVEPASGKTFSVDRSDWRWIFGARERIRDEYAKGDVKIVIFTNQSGIYSTKGYNAKTEAMLKGKLKDIIADVGVPVQVFMAGGDDEYRKPSTKTWDVMVEKYNCGVKPALDKCIFVGDAAGRPAGPNRKKGKKDFSCSDRKFAFNIGIPFKTPDEFFKGVEPEAFDWDAPDLSKLKEGELPFKVSDKQEMIILVGHPGCGKSTFSKTYLIPNGYVHVNRDTLKTPAKCLSATEAALSSGKSVVIDNTNPSAEARSQYIQAAKKHGVPVRCVHFDIPEDVAKHMNFYRERLGISAHVPRIGYAVFNKQFQPPTKEEGFTEIIERPLMLHFPDEHSKDLFYKYA